MGRELAVSASGGAGGAEGVAVAAEVTGGGEGEEVEVAEAACEGGEEAAGAAVLSVPSHSRRVCFLEK